MREKEKEIKACSRSDLKKLQYKQLTRSELPRLGRTTEDSPQHNLSFRWRTSHAPKPRGGPHRLGRAEITSSGLPSNAQEGHSSGVSFRGKQRAMFLENLSI